MGMTGSRKKLPGFGIFFLPKWRGLFFFPSTKLLSYEKMEIEISVVVRCLFNTTDLVF